MYITSDVVFEYIDSLPTDHTNGLRLLGTHNPHFPSTFTYRIPSDDNLVLRFDVQLLKTCLYSRSSVDRELQ